MRVRQASGRWRRARTEAVHGRAASGRSTTPTSTSQLVDAALRSRRRGRHWGTSQAANPASGPEAEEVPVSRPPRTMSELRTRADNRGGIYRVSKRVLRNICGYQRLGPHVARQISQKLAADGMVHLPEQLPVGQERVPTTLVRSSREARRTKRRKARPRPSGSVGKWDRRVMTLTIAPRCDNYGFAGRPMNRRDSRGGGRP